MSYDYFEESHNILRESVRRFVEKELKPHVDGWEDAESFPVALYRKMAEAGFLGLGFPEDLGGTPCDVFHTVVFVEEMVRCGSSGLVAGLGSHGIALPPIVRMGTEEQKKRFVPPVLGGEKIAALAITEPDAGSDVANIRTKAVREGDHYVVNGAKTFITSGTRAHLITTAVRTGGEGFPGVSLLVIDASSPGFSVSRTIRKMGWHASDTGELVFEDCIVPAANLLGNEGDGFYGIMENFQMERLSMAVMAHATAELAFDETLRYCRERSAFGRPLSGFQVLRHRLVDMATKVEVAKEFDYRVAARLNEGLDAVKEVSMAKNFACEACDSVVHDAVQLHGGYGYAREYLVERLYRDSRILSIGGGTTEIMKEIISKLLGL